MSKNNLGKRAEFIQDHYRYERDMLRDSFSELEKPMLDRVIKNALIESFCIHARNLIEFFKKKSGCDFDPRDFAKQGYSLNKRFIGDSIWPKINNQVSHLTRNRTSKANEKINFEMMKQIRVALDKEIARFEQNLAPTYHQLLNSPPGAQSSDGQSTNQIQIIGGPLPK